jgi:hypothetical protein
MQQTKPKQRRHGRIDMKDTFLVIDKHSIYFRVLGYGLAFNMYSIPLFSERIGVRKPLFRYKKFTVRFLRPIRHG